MNQLSILAYSGQTITIVAPGPAGGAVIDIYDSTGAWVPFTGPAGTSYSLPANPFGAEFVLVPSAMHPITSIVATAAAGGGTQYNCTGGGGTTITVVIN
jgi:hypothetical protein